MEKRERGTTAVSLSERDFQAQVIDYAHLRGWLVAAFRPCESAKGWRTPMQGDVGYPDLTMARGGRVVFAELKAAMGRMSVAQRGWLSVLDLKWESYHASSLANTGMVAVYVWHPSDWDTIMEILK